MPKNPLWKQNCPIDQYIATRAGLEGTISMIEDHLESGQPEKALRSAKHALVLSGHLAELTEYLRRNPQEWTDEND